MSTFQEIDNVVVVDGSRFIKHDYYLHRIPQLVESLHRLGITGKKLKLSFLDGEPIRYTGIEHVLAILAAEFNLSPKDLIVETQDIEFRSAYASNEYRPALFFRQCKHQLAKWREQQLDSDAVLFGATFGRYTLERFLMSAFLETHHKDKSFVIFQPPPDTIEFEFSSLEDMFQQELTWFKTYKRDEHSLESTHNGTVSWQTGCDDYANIWSKYLIEIVAETDVHCNSWITEKTIRCLITGKPFIAIAGPGFLKWLQTLGVKTYNHLIDESYDQEVRATVRLEMIKEEINKIARYTPDQLAVFMQGLNEVATYNKQQFSKISNEYYKTFN